MSYLDIENALDYTELRLRAEKYKSLFSESASDDLMKAAFSPKSISDAESMDNHHLRLIWALYELKARTKMELIQYDEENHQTMIGVFETVQALMEDEICPSWHEDTTLYKILLGTDYHYWSNYIVKAHHKASRGKTNGMDQIVSLVICLASIAEKEQMLDYSFLIIDNGLYYLSHKPGFEEKHSTQLNDYISNSANPHWENYEQGKNDRINYSYRQ